MRRGEGEKRGTSSPLWPSQEQLRFGSVRGLSGPVFLCGSSLLLTFVSFRVVFSGFLFGADGINCTPQISSFLSKRIIPWISWCRQIIGQWSFFYFIFNISFKFISSCDLNYSSTQLVYPFPSQKNSLSVYIDIVLMEVIQLSNLEGQMSFEQSRLNSA